MSSTPTSRQGYPRSHGPGDRGSVNESSIDPGHATEDPRSYHNRKPQTADPQGRDERFPQTYSTKPQAQRRLSTKEQSDGTYPILSTDQPGYDNYTQRVASVGYDGSSRYEKDGHSSRNRRRDGM